MTFSREDGFVSDKMLELRTVGVVERITKELAVNVEHDLLRMQLTSNEPITLLINSAGGESRPAMMLHDIIYYGMTAPVRAVVIGECNSAATFILLACKERVSMPHATFTIHSSTTTVAIQGDEITLQKVPRLHSEIQKWANIVENFYCKKLNISPERVKELISRGDDQFDSAMDAKEAIELGLITDIVDKNIGVFSTPKTV